MLTNLNLAQGSLQNLNWWADIKAKAAAAEVDLEKFDHKVAVDYHHYAPIVMHDGKVAIKDIKLAGKECGSNALCTELAHAGFNKLDSVNKTAINKWVASNKYGQWCAANAECTKVAMMAKTDANAMEAKEIQNWLHPTASLQNLNWWADIKAKAAAAEVDLEKFDHKVAVDYHHYAPIVMHDGKVAIKDIKLAGQACGSNALCTALAHAGINKLDTIKNIEITKWVKSNKYGQWCAANAECTKVAMMAKTDATAMEAKEIQNWLHPTASLQNLNWWADIKAKAAAAEADLKKLEQEAAAKAAAAKAEVEKINQEAAAKAAAAKAVIDNINQKAAADFHHYAPIVMHDGQVAIKDGKVAIKDIKLAGQVCGSNDLCTELAHIGFNKLDSVNTTLINKYVVEGKYGKFCAANAECTKVAMMAQSQANATEAKEIQNWLHPTVLILMMI